MAAIERFVLETFLGLGFPGRINYPEFVLFVVNLFVNNYNSNRLNLPFKVFLFKRNLKI